MDAPHGRGIATGRAMGLICIFNGPNLNLLGTREPEIYGRDTLDDVETLCVEKCRELGHAMRFMQSNSEGDLVTWIQEARGKADAIVINPAAYTHTSIAIRDALSAFEGPFIEVHISNVHARESFRHHSYVSGIASAVIAGCGIAGYGYAIDTVARLLGHD
jgi:3-dehydroquinate dehydratase-2